MRGFLAAPAARAAVTAAGIDPTVLPDAGTRESPAGGQSPAGVRSSRSPDEHATGGVRIFERIDCSTIRDITTQARHRPSRHGPAKMAGEEAVNAR